MREVLKALSVKNRNINLMTVLWIRLISNVLCRNLFYNCCYLSSTQIIHDEQVSSTELAQPLLAILVRLWGRSEPYTDVLHNSSHTGSGIIVYGMSLKLRILRLIEVVHRWFSKRKHILRQLTGWCAICSGNIPASCDRAYRSARRLRNDRGYKPCLSIIFITL